jgi:hypothetical protein
MIQESRISGTFPDLFAKFWDFQEMVLRAVSYPEF